MSRYFLHLAYQGTAYRGWQRQPRQPSVQQTLEERLARVLGREEIKVHGCGRTDAGVHASQYFASFDHAEPLPEHFRYALNRQLPSDISVFECIPVGDRAASQSDATERTYDYFLHFAKEAGLDYRSSKVDSRSRPDPTRLDSLLPQLTGRHDFRTFCKTPDRHHHTRCDLRAIHLWSDPAGRYWRFQFVADRFLRGMIRLLVGNFLAVAEDRLGTDELLSRFQATAPLAHHRLAPPDGLYLSRVRYPYLERENASRWLDVMRGLTS